MTTLQEVCCQLIAIFNPFLTELPENRINPASLLHTIWCQLICLHLFTELALPARGPKWTTKKLSRHSVTYRYCMSCNTPPEVQQLQVIMAKIAVNTKACKYLAPPLLGKLKQVDFQ